MLYLASRNSAQTPLGTSTDATYKSVNHTHSECSLQQLDSVTSPMILQETNQTGAINSSTLMNSSHNCCAVARMRKIQEHCLMEGACSMMYLTPSEHPSLNLKGPKDQAVSTENSLKNRLSTNSRTRVAKKNLINR